MRSSEWFSVELSLLWKHTLVDIASLAKDTVSHLSEVLGRIHFELRPISASNPHLGPRLGNPGINLTQTAAILFFLFIQFSY